MTEETEATPERTSMMLSPEGEKEWLYMAYREMRAATEAARERADAAELWRKHVNICNKTNIFSTIAIFFMALTMVALGVALLSHI